MLKKQVEAELAVLQKQSHQNKKVVIKNQKRDKLYKRLQVINAFINSGQDPKSMIIKNLPVIPADLRPLVQLDGSRHSTSDCNELYRRIIIRNNRLKRWKESEAPVIIIQNEMRMLQEAIDALIDNQKKTTNQVTTKENRPLKSISDSLTGKRKISSKLTWKTCWLFRSFSYCRWSKTKNAPSRTAAENGRCSFWALNYP